MGEIANDMIKGFCCSWCGIYFKKPHEFPVICVSCWQNYKSENEGMIESKLLEDCGVQVAFEKEL